MLRVFLAMTIAAGSAAYGQILLRRGMLQVGSLENYAPLALVTYFWHALCNPYVIGGTVLNAVFYFLFMAALSWTDVTVALPFTAIEYAFAAVLAVALLKEIVPPVRWMGIALVILGVILIARGGGDT
jgi:drug/metabolite transporter (DMT)-like permease